MNTAELGKLLICFVSVNFHPVSCILSWYPHLRSLDPVYVVERWGLASKTMAAAKTKAEVIALFVDLKAGRGHCESVSCPSTVIQALKLYPGISLSSP